MGWKGQNYFEENWAERILKTKMLVLKWTTREYRSIEDPDRKRQKIIHAWKFRTASKILRWRSEHTPRVSFPEDWEMLLDASTVRRNLKQIVYHM